MCGLRATGLGNRCEVLAEPAEVIDSLIDIDVLCGHDHCEVGCVRLDERLYEHVLGMVMQVQQIEEVRDSGEDPASTRSLSLTSTAGLDRRLGIAANALVDLSVES
jgi:hypothetical protein